MRLMFLINVLGASVNDPSCSGLSPDTSEEQVAAIVEHNVRDFIDGTPFAEALKCIGAELEQEDIAIETTLEDIQHLLQICPTLGCVSTLRE